MANSWIDQVIAKAAADADFKAALISQPTQTVNGFLAEAGFDKLADDVTVTVTVQADGSVNLSVPASDEISEDDLAKVAGGAPRAGRYEGPGTT